MFGYQSTNCRVLLHRFVLFLSSIGSQLAMHLRNRRSFKWIRKLLQSRVNPTKPPEGKKTKCLDEVVVNDTKIDTAQFADGAGGDSNDADEDDGCTTTSSNCNAANSSRATTAVAAIDYQGASTSTEIVVNRSRSAAADDEMQTCSSSTSAIDDGSSFRNTPTPTTTPTDGKNSTRVVVTAVVGEGTVRRSKSRVRSYLKKCKDRLTGHHPQDDELMHCTVADCFHEPLSTVVVVEGCGGGGGGVLDSGDVNGDGDGGCCGTETSTDACYEDIEFNAVASEVLTSTSSSTSFSQLNCQVIGVIDEIGQKQSKQQELDLSSKALILDSGITQLIDCYLSDVYPVYFEHTRAILIRQARDLLVCTYHGCLKTFEESFLRTFAKIASDLRQKHSIGESIAWCKGWPLATHSGELILHLGALDESLLRPCEIYLCVKPVEDNSNPQLYAVWRTPPPPGPLAASATTTTSVHSQLIVCHDKNYLSALALEMLSDELPQLLQNLLVGVERAIGRLSLNDLAFPQDVDSFQFANYDNNGNSISPTHRSAAATASGSPKCALKRSELITKNNNNKMLNNKYILRRLSNRQDVSGSMTSSLLSSGNSVSNNESASNDEMTTIQPPNSSSCSSSMSMPLFCLGNSFPHIDSDEENPDDKRTSASDCDNLLADEIVVAPRCIGEIPEKLLTSGIYLPGTRDLNGRPIVTVDAESVTASGLNCYEIATVLLYYSTIPERSSSHSNHSVNNSSSNKNNNNNGNTDQHQQYQQHEPAYQTFTILIAIEKSNHLSVIDLICNSLKLLTSHVQCSEILAVCLDSSLLLSKQMATTTATTATAPATTATTVTTMTTNSQYDQQQQQQHLRPHSVKLISVDQVTTSVAASQVPSGKCNGLHHHDQRKWREIFALIDPFQSQCLQAGQRLVAAMGDIRSSDLQGLPTRRQLYAQHRALSRALMDSELHNLRKRGPQTLARLQDLAKNLNSHQNNGSSTSSTNNNNNTSSSNSSNNSVSHNTNNNNNNNSNSSRISCTSYTKSAVTPATTTTATRMHHHYQQQQQQQYQHYHNNNNNNYSTTAATTTTSKNIDVAIRLNKVTVLFNEVDRAAMRLEQLTEQRRERLRELTRQRALEDEINEVTTWITSDGNETLQRFSHLQLDCETAIKEHEQEFEKYYFISMKHLAKGRDLHDAAINLDSLQESATNLKSALDSFAEKLEQARERIEGASRLHHLLGLHIREEDVQLEMQRLAEKIGVPALLEKCSDISQRSGSSRSSDEEEVKTPTNIKDCSENRNSFSTTIATKSKPNLSCSRNFISNPNAITATPSSATTPTTTTILSSMTTSTPDQKLKSSSSRMSAEEMPLCHCWREPNGDHHDEEVDDEEEEQSKIADSGLGGCDRCEGNPKLSRICSCQSLNEAGNLCDKSHNSDELDDECFVRTNKRFLDIHSPIEANSHLQCHASNLDLPQMEELSCLEPKIQKTLLLIMREMIGTERDYVRSLYYVIENYVDELLRDDIPQPLRGQRNVIFGNIEKIFEFHQPHFLAELERYECNPLKVGAAFLETESKFYLYALYNKNKPKSDTLMSEYGTAFFKSKQIELNDKMDLASYLLKPVQRMGKYALLLQQLVKACSSVEGAALQEISADVEELQRAEEMVKFQLRHGNDLLAMDSLRDCDVNVKEQGRLLRQNEFLVWQGRGGKKTLRQVFLFEELVLFSKARRFPDHKNLDIYIYKNSIKTSDIGLTAHTGDSPTKFEIWFRKRKPDDTWTLQCMSADIKNAWTEEISKLLWKQAKRNREIRLAEMSSMGIGSKPCLDIRPSNNQISDRSITITQLGKAPKLRHSFVGLLPENGKAPRRPNSLISESSMSSGTSSSSISTGGSSSSGSGKNSGINNSNSSGGGSSGLELINETQTLMLTGGGGIGTNAGNHTSRNHKRSTTLVSQLSMESGIMSDISITPDNESQEPAWPLMRKHSNTSSSSSSAMSGGNEFAHHHRKHHQDDHRNEEVNSADHPYIEDNSVTVHL